MFNFLILFHKNIFLGLHSLSRYNELVQHIVLFFAKIIDVYVVLFAVIVLTWLLYQSFLKKSGKKFFLYIQEFVQIFISVSVAYLISFLLKNLISAPRPFLRFPNEVSPLFHYGGFNSFPSGHATLFMSLGVMIYLYNRKLGVLFIILALLIALARVIVGIHFPIDILAGWAIGAGVSLFVYKQIK